jgi:protein TonB
MFHEKKERFVKMPIYEGGQKALNKFVAENLRYPADAQKGKIEGTVQVFYIINNKGDVIDAKVTSSLGHGCDEEALRLVKLLKYTIPRNHKLKATFNKKINIHFKLSKQVEPINPVLSKPVTPLQIQYNITPSIQSKPAQASKISYNIEIKLNK